MTHIGERPTGEMYASGLELGCRCARCGSSIDTEWCNECEDGPIYDEDDGDVSDMLCDACDGRGAWHSCMASWEWCLANPLPGREDIARGTVEWFTIGG